MGQRVISMDFNASVKDLWTGVDITGDSGEERGFGNTIDAASIEAAARLAERLGRDIGVRLVEVVAKKNQ